MAGRLSKGGRTERRPRWFPVGDVVAPGWSKDGLFGVSALGGEGRAERACGRNEAFLYEGSYCS